MTTTFSDQQNNLVFASPDGSNGQPSFRALTSNDVPSIGIETSILTGNIQGSNSQEVYATSSFLIPANSAYVGQSFKVSIAGTMDGAIQFPAVTFVSPEAITNLRVGPNGDISDNIVITATASGLSGNVLSTTFYQDFILTIKTIGANASLFAVAPTQSNNVPLVTSAIFTFDSTSDVHIGASFISSVGMVSNRTGQNNHVELGIVEQIK